jgi:prepilin-type N-terminal cleavage/methylation domain-containing protein
MAGGVAVRQPLEQGFSLVETMIAMAVLTTGVLGAAAILSAGLQNLGSTPSDVVATQKAAQAVESVFAARDSRKLQWSRIRNVSDGGVFLNGPQSLTVPGADGLVNTADDGAVETGTLGGNTVTLSQYTREIKLDDVANENGQLRAITITLKYQNGPTSRIYTLKTFISAYS